MNTLDRKRLYRLSAALEHFALPHSGYGTRSASDRGNTLYAQDARVFMPALRDTLNAIWMSSVNDATEGIDYPNPDNALNALEGWVQRRSAADWQPPTEDLDVYQTKPTGREDGE